MHFVLRRHLLRGLTMLLALGIFAALSLADGANRRLLKRLHFERKAQAAYEAQDWQEAIRCYGIVERLSPFDGGTAYNLACCCALAGQTEAALAALSRAIDYGWDDAEWIQRDTDLASIQNAPEMGDLLERAEACAAERFVSYVPAAVDPAKPAPLVVVLHGFGGNAHEFIAYWKEAADAHGALLVAPRGTSQAGQRAQMRYGWHKSLNPQALDLEGAKKAVADAIAFAQRTGTVDEGRIVLAGFSQGATVAIHLLHDAPERYAGAVAVAAFYAIPEDGSWEALAEKRPVRLALVVGQADDAIGVNVDAHRKLTKFGHKVDLNELPVMVHEMPENYTEVLSKALGFVLGAS